MDDRRNLAAWASECAEQVLGIFESAEPGDPRVRDAVAQARAFASGDLGVAEAIATWGGQAGAAAREAGTPAAKAAAYAAEQAAAVAHMGAHALGAVGYAGKAAILAGATTPDAASEVIAHVARESVALLSESSALVLAQLPALGADGAGPLGPGRLSSGAVGETIRAIQTQFGRAQR